MKTLTFDELVASVDRDTLAQTAKLELVNGGLPKSRPVEHFQVLNDFEDIIDKSKILKNAELVADPIYISKRHAARVNYEGDPELCPINKYLCRRLITRYTITRGFHDSDATPNDDFSTSIGIAYTENGIQVAYGMNVSICSNMTIFGGNVYKTYGRGKLDYETILDVVNSKISNHEKYLEENISAVRSLKGRIVDEKRRDKIFGKLIQQATLLQNQGVNNRPPLNITQCVNMIRESRDSKTNPMTSENTMWDVLQWGTAILKPKNNDMETLLPHIQHFSNYIYEN